MATRGPGLTLARNFYHDVVAPLVHTRHTACLIGEGSEVLGYDTERSRDHEWGPRVQIFVDHDQVEGVRQSISAGLPETYAGYPTSWFSLIENRVTDHVEVGTAEEWLTKLLRVDLSVTPDTATWLAWPQQHLLQLTAGEVFHDEIGTVTRIRSDVEWFPADVWLWLIASQWHLLAITFPFLGRSIENDDRRNARLITDRLCRLMMEMAFLQERRYQPYLKWFGRAFDDLEAAATIGPLLDQALADHPSARNDDALSKTMIMLAERHNTLNITASIGPKIEDFDVNVNNARRPYPVLNTQEFILATLAAITDPALRDLPRVGSIDQLTHADDTLINFSSWPQSLAETYRTMLGHGPG